MAGHPDAVKTAIARKWFPDHFAWTENPLTPITRHDIGDVKQRAHRQDGSDDYGHQDEDDRPGAQ